MQFPALFGDTVTRAQNVRVIVSMVTPYGHYFLNLTARLRLLPDSLIADPGQLHARLLYNLYNNNENCHRHEHHLCLIAVIALFARDISQAAASYEAAHGRIRQDGGH